VQRYVCEEETCIEVVVRINHVRSRLGGGGFVEEECVDGVVVMVVGRKHVERKLCRGSCA